MACSRRRLVAGFCGAAATLAVLACGGGVALAGVPTIGSISGTLTTPGTLSGIARISFGLSGDDGDTYSATLSVDGAPAYSTPVSPPLETLGLDTAAYTDGSHNVAITLSDGEGDLVAVWSGTIETLNAPQGGIPSLIGKAVLGDTLDTEPGAWSPSNGASFAYQWQRCNASGCTAIAGATTGGYTLTAADVGERVAVTVTASNSDGSSTATSPLSAVVVANAGEASGGGSNLPPALSNGSGVCGTPTLRVALNGAASARVAWGATPALRGEIECGGAGISGATLDLTLTPRGGSGPTSEAEIRSAPDGSFSYLVPAGPSRSITVSYSAVTGGAVVASARATLLVTAKITLSVTPTHTTNGHTITFRGRVSGGNVPKHGLPIEIEYREGSSWMIYTEVTAKPGAGSFSYRYTFQRTTQPITYSFRVATPASGVPGYPFEPAVSPARAVHVDP